MNIIQDALYPDTRISFIVKGFVMLVTKVLLYLGSYCVLQ